MLAHRLRRWANIKPTLAYCPVFAGVILSTVQRFVWLPAFISTNWSLISGQESRNIENYQKYIAPYRPAKNTLANATTWTLLLEILEWRHLTWNFPAGVHPYNLLIAY